MLCDATQLLPRHLTVDVLGLLTHRRSASRSPAIKKHRRPRAETKVRPGLAVSGGVGAEIQKLS
jgi:hypothetical protein